MTRSSDQGVLYVRSLIILVWARIRDELSTAKFDRCLWFGVMRYDWMRPSYSPRREDVSVGMGTLTCPRYVLVSCG